MFKGTIATLAGICLLAAGFGPAVHSASAANAGVQPRSFAGLPEHMVGAFNIDSPSQVSSAGSDGMRVAFHYGQPWGDLSQSYQQAGMPEINAQISAYLWDYECHRVHTVVTVPRGAWGFCSSDVYPSMDYANLMATVGSYLQQIRSFPGVRGFWILDDWPWYDATAAPVLAAIHRLVQRYDPALPTICGFGAHIIPGGSEWNPALASNFTPQGCNEIAWYVYADTVSGYVPSASQYDWSMSGLLPEMRSAFQSRGWNPSQTPLIGIPQAYGGQSRSDGSYEVVPTQASIVQQSRALCQSGASSLVFYGWSLSDFTNPQTPSTNSDISNGVRGGISTCQQVWGTQQTAPVPSSTPVPVASPSPGSTGTPVPAGVISPIPSSGPVVSLEAENTTLSGSASTGSYPSASNGRYLQFPSATDSASACPRYFAGGGMATTTLRIATSGSYTVWSRLQVSGGGIASYWLQIDAACPINVRDLPGVGDGSWAWVNTRDGNPNAQIVVPLASGFHVVHLISRTAGVDLDRIVFSPAGSCTPVGMGDNCAS
ncbi:MAG: hypothetical protein ACRDFX_13385 [Chloroflexota bacterium]